MMEFIVLGQVPGTEFQITFNLIRSVLLLLLVIALVRLDIKLYHDRSYKRLESVRRSRLLTYTTEEFNQQLHRIGARARSLAVRIARVAASMAAWIARHGYAMSARTGAAVWRASKFTAKMSYEHAGRLTSSFIKTARESRAWTEAAKFAAKASRQVLSGIASTGRRIRLWYAATVPRKS